MYVEIKSVCEGQHMKFKIKANFPTKDIVYNLVGEDDYFYVGQTADYSVDNTKGSKIWIKKDSVEFIEE